MLKTSTVQIATMIQPAIRSQRARGSPFSSSGTPASSGIPASAGASWATPVTASACVVGAAATARKDARTDRRLTLTPAERIAPECELVGCPGQCQHLVQRENAQVVLPGVGLALRTA